MPFCPCNTNITVIKYYSTNQQKKKLLKSVNRNHLDTSSLLPRTLSPKRISFLILIFFLNLCQNLVVHLHFNKSFFLQTQSHQAGEPVGGLHHPVSAPPSGLIHLSLSRSLSLISPVESSSPPRKTSGPRLKP